jgi:isoleucyl-tRNA synthetase
MQAARLIASKGLEARMKAKINVRQPLSRLVSGIQMKTPDLFEVVKDEVNVKEISFDPKLSHEVELDTAMTPELKEEGDLRELIRAIQDMRKEAGLSVGDMASLSVPADKKALVDKYASQIKKAASISDIVSGEALSVKRI